MEHQPPGGRMREIGRERKKVGYDALILELGQANVNAAVAGCEGASEPSKNNSKESNRLS